MINHDKIIISKFKYSQINYKNSTLNKKLGGRMKNKINFKRKLNNNAVNSVISFLLVIMMFFSATGAILVWGPSYIKSEEDRQINKAMVSVYNSIKDNLQPMVTTGKGASYVGEISNKDGSININSNGDRLIVTYSFDPDYDFQIYDITDGDNEFYMEMNGKDISDAIVYYLDDSCFLAGTSVSMADGSLKNIEDIVSGDLVRSYNIETGSFVVAKVSSLLSFEPSVMDGSYLVFNDILRVTSNHLLFVDGSWVEAGSVSAGYFFDSLGRDVYVNSIKKVSERVRVYDLLLEDSSSYFADGFLVKSDAKLVYISENEQKMSSKTKNLNSLGTVAREKHISVWHDHPLSKNFKATDRDCTLSENSPDIPYPDSDHLVVDPMWDTWDGCRNRVLVKMPFDENNIPEFSKIIDAEVNLLYWTWDTWSNPGTFRNHEIWECDEDWDENSATWNNAWENRRIEDGEIYIATLNKAGPYDWINWNVTESIQEFVGKKVYYEGNPPSVLVYLSQYDQYHGWMIKDKKDDDGNPSLRTDIYYHSSEDNGGEWTPNMDVTYIAPPDIETEDATNIGSTSAKLNAYLYYDGGGLTECYFKWGYDSLTTETGHIFSYDYSSGGADLEEMLYGGLHVGDLVYFKAFAENSAIHTSGVMKKFITVPPAPTSFHSTGKNCDRVYLSWDKAAVDGEGQDIYTKILYSTDHYPEMYNEDEIDPSVHSCIRMGESASIFGLTPETKYYFSAFTNVTEDGAYQTSDSFVSCDVTTTPNYSPSMPQKPSGSETVGIGENNGYSTVSTDANGHMIRYQYNWNASGSPIMQYSGWIPSGQTVTLYHSWSDVGYYDVRVRAQDRYQYYHTGEWTGWSDYLTVLVQPSENDPPIVSKPSGPTDIFVDETHTYSTIATDPEGEKVYLNFSWGDGSHSDWLGPYFSGETVECSHSWSTNDTFSVKVQAKDESDYTSEWTDGLTVFVNLSGSGESIPSTPQAPEFIQKIYYNNTGYTIKSKTTEPNGNRLFYKFDFGDGNESAWVGPYQSDETVYINNSWDKKDVYEIRVKAANDPECNGHGSSYNSLDGKESSWSDPMVIRVRYKYIKPADTIGSPEKIQPQKTYNTDGTVDKFIFETSQNLEGAVCIQLFDDKYPSIAPGDDKGNVSFGAIWLFDLGSISHTPNGLSESSTILQNGGVLSSLPSGTYIDSMSNVYESDGLLGFSVTMFRAGQYTAGGGSGTFRIDFENLNTFTREQQDYSVYNFKLKFSGDHSSYWQDYLYKNYDFDCYDANGYLVYNSYLSSQLVFSTSLIKASLI